MRRRMSSGGGMGRDRRALALPVPRRALAPAPAPADVALLAPALLSVPAAAADASDALPEAAAGASASALPDAASSSALPCAAADDDACSRSSLRRRRAWCASSGSITRHLRLVAVLPPKISSLLPTATAEWRRPIHVGMARRTEERRGVDQAWVRRSRQCRSRFSSPSRRMSPPSAPAKTSRIDTGAATPLVLLPAVAVEPDADDADAAAGEPALAAAEPLPMTLPPEQ